MSLLGYAVVRQPSIAILLERSSVMQPHLYNKRGVHLTSWHTQNSANCINSLLRVFAATLGPEVRTSMKDVMILV